MSEQPTTIVAFIPARMESTRFPGKPLADLLGKPMIMRAFERTKRSSLLDQVYVVTDSDRIFDAVVDGKESEKQSLLTELMKEYE